MKTLYLLLAAAFVVLPASANAQDILSTEVLSTRQATQVDLGSKKALGYYGKQNGKCNLTVMVFDKNQDASSENASAARLKVLVTPGTTASLESVNGRSVAFFCGSGARRMTVMTLGNKPTLPNT